MELNITQKNILLYIQDYINQYKQPIPRTELIQVFGNTNSKLSHTLTQLIKRGYLSRIKASGQFRSYGILRTVR